MTEEQNRILEGLELMFVANTLNDLKEMYPSSRIAAAIAELERIADVAESRSDVVISRQELIDYLSAKYA